VKNLCQAPGLPEAWPAMQRAVALAEAASAEPALTRQAASALYHVTSAAAMAWEAERIGDPARLRLARLVLRHRVLPRDPLEADDADGADLAELLGDVGG